VTEALTHFIENAGWFAPLYYVGSFLLTALLPVIPTPLVGAMGGKAFGFLPALAYGFFGLAFGALVSLNLSRRVGRPLVSWFVRPSKWKRWEEFLGIESVIVWGLFFFLLNLDFLVLISGLTTIKLRRLWLTAMITRLPWLAASIWLGDVVLVSDAIMWVALILTLPVLYVMARITPIVQNWLNVVTEGRVPRN
jgi:uncharacterized membrane protein YdjX (TVP38/TMEM64 family)